MSLKQLEKAIKNRHNTNIVEWREKHPKEPMTMFERCACDLELQFRKVEVEFNALKKQLEEKAKMGIDGDLWKKHHDAMWKLWEEAEKHFKWSHTGDKFRGFAMGYVMAQKELLEETK